MEPGSVTARTSNTPIVMYGNNAKKYDAFPELCIPEFWYFKLKKKL